MTEQDDIPSPREREIEQAADRIARAMLFDDPVAAVEAVKAKEGVRRTKLLRQTRLDAKADAEREAAELEIRSGVFVNVGDAVVPPTPEWLAKHETRPVTVQADGEGHHARSVKTVRRVVTSHARRAYNAGKINERQWKACEWYRLQYDLSGLGGRMKTANFNQRIVGGPHMGILFNEQQIEAQTHLRDVRLLINAAMLAFFDMVVIDEISVDRAARLSRAGRNPYDTLRSCADCVGDYVEAVVNV